MKYPPGTLVTFDEAIFEVISSQKNSYGQQIYTIENRAFLRRETFISDKREHYLKPYTIEVREEELTAFSAANKPKFRMGDRVTLNGIKCIVGFIDFESHHYFCHAMEDGYWGIRDGWRVDEDYLQKR